LAVTSSSINSFSSAMHLPSRYKVTLCRRAYMLRQNPVNSPVKTLNFGRG
jgi:hypothetical protein